MSRLCHHCQKPIPTFLLVEGRHVKTALGRKACFDCRPIGCFDNREPKLRETESVILKGGYLVCNICSEKKLLQEFNFSNNKKGYQANCKTCAANLKKAYRLSVKQKCVAYKGGKCLLCGYKTALSSLCFHHLDPTTKRFSIALPFRREWNDMQKELDKCVLVCSNCHGELHEGIKKLPKGF